MHLLLVAMDLLLVAMHLLPVLVKGSMLIIRMLGLSSRDHEQHPALGSVLEQLAKNHKKACTFL